MKTPIVALMYDFDKTLSTRDMQEYGFLPELGMSPSEFWKEVNDLTDTEEMDGILAYMYLMVEKCKEKKICVTKEKFNALGQGIQYFEGVDSWFDRINRIAEEAGVCAEHYIVSSGLKEIIEGTSIARAGYFKKIYACEFMYDYNGLIQWPKFAVNYTAKTQFLYRINKGILNVDSASADMLNGYMPEEERRIPFQNMIYIGDGLTDVPCMKLVKVNGGQSIAVYNQANGKDSAQPLVFADRVNYCIPADYREGSVIESVVRSIFRKIRAVSEMESFEN